MPKKKVLIFLQGGVGGAERMSVLIGKSLDTEVFEVKFCAIDRNGGVAICDFIPAGYHVEKIPTASPIRMMLQLFRCIRKEKPYAVFSSVMYLNTKILPFRLFFPETRFVVRCENYLYTFSKKQRVFIGLTYFLADTIIAQTKEMADELYRLKHIGKDKVVVIQNPVDAELIDRDVADCENPYPGNGYKHFVASGRFAYQKGFDLLFEAFTLLTKNGLKADLYIVGDSQYNGGKIYQQLMQRAAECGLADRLHCVGYQKKPYPYIRYADCFVLSSRWEGLPNVLIEALYLGTPVAAFRCIPVIERIVDEGKTGFLAEKENVEQLADAMTNALGLGRIESKYRVAVQVDFVRIFL